MANTFIRTWALMTELQKKARGPEWIVTVDRSQYLTVVYRFTHAPQQPCLLSHTFPPKSPLPPFPPSTTHCMLESPKTSRDNFTRPLPARLR